MKNPFPKICAAAALLALVACGNPNEPGPTTNAVIRDANGVEVGRATLSDTNDGVHIWITTTGVSAGTHGAHVHAVGSCEGPSFASAGGHLNPDGRQHGAHNPAGSHLGDLPNLIVSSDGSGELTTTLPGASLEAPGVIFDADGASVVIHAVADDQVTDPAGNAGARIACGVITRG